MQINLPLRLPYQQLGGCYAPPEHSEQPTPISLWTACFPPLNKFLQKKKKNLCLSWTYYGKLQPQSVLRKLSQKDQGLLWYSDLKVSLCYLSSVKNKK